MEPRTTGGFGLPTYRAVTNEARLRELHQWLDNESARRALDLYALACGAADSAADGTSPPPYYIALVPGGNHADRGFALQTDTSTKDHSQRPYIKLDADPDTFQTTLLHETGHIVLAVLNRGEGVPRRELAAIPHTTSALTDRGTAFDEGFAIYLETLAAHLTQAPELRRYYHRERIDCASPKQKVGEYFRHAVDLLTFSQTLARYHEVRENNFAFAPAHRGPDYLRVQLEKVRDFATLRDANQLLQCEGFYASFFFACTFRGDGLPPLDVLEERQRRLLATLAEMLRSYPADEDAPHLLHFVATYMRLFSDDAGEIVEVLNDLSHGVFVDADAVALWREYYLAALRLDMPQLPKDRINAARLRWREGVLSDPQVLHTRLGPQLSCRVPDCAVRLVALGKERPLQFDLNTAEEGVLRLIPGISDAEVTRWIAARAQRPFQSAADFRQRVELSAAAAGKLRI
jgi:hypothetical protein